MLRRNSGRTTRPFAREPYTTVFRQMLRMARELRASDLHIIAGRPPLVRVAGQLVPRGEPLDPQVVEDMILCRVPGRLTQNLDKDGSCDFAIDEPELGRLRVNAMRQRTGISATLRLIAPGIPTLASLGLPEAIAEATRHHQGLIVLTGPTGHGKTTTLAALVDILNTETTRHIITVEDPIEYLHPRKRALMSQREIGAHTRSFERALKASLREDPDVIVVGELRDTETVRMALSASETGHLVLGTMNTPSAAKTIDRLIDLFPPADQPQVRMTLAGGLKLIVSQRLVPAPDGLSMVAAVEVLPGMVPLWNLIRENRTYQIPSLQQRGKALGVVRLDDSLAELARANKVNAAAAIAVAESPEELEQTLGLRRAGSVPAMPRVVAPTPGQKPPEPKPGEQPKGIFERAGALFKKGS
jgi:twitching motility protein PilT